MKWKTRISRIDEGEHVIRGMKITEMIKDMSFVESLLFILHGKRSTPQEKELLDAILVACVEHGIHVPSAFVPRVVMSTGNTVNAALAAGALAIGDHHGGAIEACAKFLQSDMTPEEVVESFFAVGKAVPGFGHKVYKDKDPRAEVLFEKAAALGFSGKHVEKLHAVHVALTAKIGRHLPINVDGPVAALMSELGLDWRIGKAFFVLGRMPGMIAHIQEEMIHEKPYRRVNEEDVEYIGD